MIIAINLPPLFAGDDELDTVALIFEPARNVEAHPTAVFTLVFVARRSGLRVAGVADAVEVEIFLTRIESQRAIVRAVKHTVAVVVLAESEDGGAKRNIRGGASLR